LSSASTIDTLTSGSSDRLEHRLALGRRQILDDIGDVGRVKLRETLVGDLQLDPARRIGLEQVDELPRDHARRNALQERAQRERRNDALRQAADRPAGADIHRDDVQEEVVVDRRRLELDVVDADHLAPVNVDDLLVEQVALEEQHAVGRREFVPLRRIGRRPHRGASGLDRVVRHDPLAVGRANDQVRDAGRMILRRDGDLAHTSAHGAGGVANGSAEQLGQRNDRHTAIVARDRSPTGSRSSGPPERDAPVRWSASL
jgi:hypothetical protein